MTETGISRRDALRRTALVAGATLWTTPVVQTLSQPAFAAGSPVEEGECFGCLTGGGQLITNGQWRDGSGNLVPVLVQFNFGNSPICCDGSPGTELEVNVHSPRGSNDPLANFHFDTNLTVVCTRDGDPEQPRACANRFTGSIFTSTGVRLDFSFADYGEPGQNVDAVSLTITDGLGTVATAEGTLTSGNLQAHLDLGPGGDGEPNLPPVERVCNCPPTA